MKIRYICPICKASLSRGEKTYFCENSHCFDISSEGYVNLAGAKKTNTEISGDAADTCRARRQFLEAGFYKKLADKICLYLKENITVKDAFIIDAGCGEGYYSRRIKETFSDYDVYGIDLAKQGVRMAAKHEKKAALKNNYCVAGIFDMPFAPNECDAIISVFAPIAREEFWRVLKKNGLLIVACPGKNHLYELKKALYEDATHNEEKIPIYDEFELLDTLRVTYKMELEAENVSALFAMTPYFWRSSKEIRDKSQRLGNMSVSADFIIKVYRKK